MIADKVALIVDDALFMREVIRDTLDGLVGVVHEAGGMEQALSLARLHTPDLVTLDLTLDTEEPAQGCRVLDQLVTIAPDAKIVVVSALDQEWLRRVVLAKGAAVYVKKPFEREKFRNVIIGILEG